MLQNFLAIELDMPPEFNPAAKSEVERGLEARTEALAFLVLGLLRASKINPAASREMVDTFAFMKDTLADPAMNRTLEHRRVCESTYAEMLLLAWGSEDSAAFGHVPSVATNPA